MDKGLLITDSSVHPKAPGMKYRHYAPKADLSIVEGCGRRGCQLHQSTDSAESSVQKVLKLVSLQRMRRKNGYAAC